MKAIVLEGFGDVDHFHQAEIESPVPKAEEVLIRIEAAAFNPIDYQMRQGRREKQLMTSPILGREMSGVIVAIGADVTGFLPGDEVMAASGSKGSNGSYAEYMAINPIMIAHKPSNISFEEAAAIPSAGLTAWQCFKRMNIQPEQRVFITGGSGAVGSFLIRILKYHGIHQVISTAGSQKSTEALLALGLDESQVINYKNTDLTAELIAANEGMLFDFVVEIVGGEISEVAAEVLKVNGTYLDVTFLGTERTRGLLFDKGCVVMNISNYAHALGNNLGYYREALNQVAALIEAGKISPPAIHIVGGLSVKTVQEAHLLMENNQGYGKKNVMKIS